jgi:hypothetical protein
LQYTLTIINIKMAINYYGLTGGAEGDTTRPELPGDFTATGGAGEVVLTWTEVGSPKHVQIEWSLTDGDYVPLVELIGGIGTYTHTGRAAGTTYYYRYRQIDRMKWTDWEKDNDTTSP